MPSAVPSTRSLRSRAALALLLLAPAPTLGVWVGMILAPGTPGQIFFGFCKIWILILPVLWRVLVDRRPISWSPPRHGGLAVGAALGLVISVIILGAYAALGDLLIERERVREIAAAVGLGQPTRYLLGAAYWILINSVLEEYIFRWFVFEKCLQVIGEPGSPRRETIAIVLAAGLFTVHHVLALSIYFDPLLTILASLGVFVGGAAWSWCYQRYRSIWPGYISHAIVDLVIFAIGWQLIFGH